MTKLTVGAWYLRKRENSTIKDTPTPTGSSGYKWVALSLSHFDELTAILPTLLHSIYTYWILKSHPSSSAFDLQFRVASHSNGSWSSYKTISIRISRIQKTPELKENPQCFTLRQTKDTLEWIRLGHRHLDTEKYKWSNSRNQTEGKKTA